MVERKGKRVALYLPNELADHVEKSRGWRTASQYIRELIDADMHPAAPLDSDEAKPELKPKSRRDGPSIEYITEVIKWKKGDQAQAMIDECAGIYAKPSIWFRLFAKEPTFFEWEAEMKSQKTPRWAGLIAR